MITAKMVHLTDDVEKNMNMWEQVVELLVSYWGDRGATLHGKEADLSVSTFINGWAGHTVRVVVAYEDDKPIGLAIALDFQHMLYSSRQLVVEVLHAPNQEAYKAMLEVLKSYVEVNGVDRTYIPVHSRDNELYNALMQSDLVEFEDSQEIRQKMVKFK